MPLRRLARAPRSTRARLIRPPPSVGDHHALPVIRGPQSPPQRKSKSLGRAFKVSGSLAPRRKSEESAPLPARLLYKSVSSPRGPAIRRRGSFPLRLLLAHELRNVPPLIAASALFVTQFLDKHCILWAYVGQCGTSKDCVPVYLRGVASPPRHCHHKAR